MKKSKWEVVDKTGIRGMFEFDQTILDRLAKAKRITLDFEEDDDSGDSDDGEDAAGGNGDGDDREDAGLEEEFDDES